MNIPKVDIDSVLQKEMTRKEFLRLAGAGVLGIVGITGFLQNVNKLASPGNHAKSVTQAHGYGSSPYGR
ncbi:MAG: hypothetical protein JWM81_1163 [Candidatus Saccharibacteria bacterium]|nr:hypothetical protein [Candidatus Saccharibacteria bacterium]